MRTDIRQQLRFWWLLPIVCLLAGCVSTRIPPVDTVCRTPRVQLDAGFDGGGMYGCRTRKPDHIEVWLTPENSPINPSPWYAVRLKPVTAGEITVTLRYAEHAHRYIPKISSTGRVWTVVPPQDVTPKAGGRRVDIRLRLGDGPLYLAGQELLTREDYDVWIDRHAEADEVAVGSLGQSVDGQPIRMLSTTTDNAAGTVILVGRQHPPEVTGALAMMRFVDEVLGDSALAKAFRDRFGLAIVPLTNPDGVTRGHWRHNVGGVDLNRDWGPFTEPETTAVRTMIDELGESPARRPVLFLDFHSTGRNVFYTQLVGEDGTDYGFTAQWLARSRTRLPEYEFERAERHQTALATSKNYMYGRFEIPSITYEVGDNTDREVLRHAARVFAQEMMQVLLAEHAGPRPAL